MLSTILGRTSRYLRKLLAAIFLHNHALYCLIKVLNLTIAAGLIWEAGYMFDVEFVKELLHVGVGELTPIVTLQHLGGMLLEEQPKHL